MQQEDDFDDVPWAPPELREKHEAALGRFMLAFNELDHLLTGLLEIVLSRLDRTDLIKVRGTEIAKKDFSFRIYVLDVLKSTPEGQGIANVPVKDLRDLAGQRAILAHAHMDQNPFDGSYRLVKSGEDKGGDFTSKRIDGMTKQAESLRLSLRNAQAFYEFSEVAVPQTE